MEHMTVEDQVASMRRSAEVADMAAKECERDPRGLFLSVAFYRASATTMRETADRLEQRLRARKEGQECKTS
jgi:hypothetical protein